MRHANSERTDFGDINGNENDGNTLIDKMTTGTGFKPIGGNGASFNGKFNGNNYEINNIYIKEEKKHHYLEKLKMQLYNH